jgi:hypothetical protein
MFIRNPGHCTTPNRPLLEALAMNLYSALEWTIWYPRKCHDMYHSYSKFIHHEIDSAPSRLSQIAQLHSTSLRWMEMSTA